MKPAIIYRSFMPAFLLTLRYRVSFLLCGTASFAAAGLHAQGTLPTVASGSVVRHWFQAGFVDARFVDVWLPNGYSAAGKYNVLYLHDGQYLFDSTVSPNKIEWDVDGTAGRLIAEQAIDSTIIVGIHNIAANRWAEFFPERVIPNIPGPQRTELLTFFNGTKRSNDYLSFIVKQVKPFIDSAYATDPRMQHTFIGGSSLGALVSLYAICEYPLIFSRAVCMSTHWLGLPTNNTQIPAAIIDYLAIHLPAPANRRLYFDYGSFGPDRFYGPYQKQVNSILASKGYSPVNCMTTFFSGADHSENAWRKRFAVPAAFILSSTKSPVNYTADPDSLQLYPNPAHSALYFKNFDAVKGRPVRLVSSDGKQLFFFTLDENRIDISQLPAGIYFLHIGNITGRTVNRHSQFSTPIIKL